MESSRTMFFHIIVESTSGCECKHNSQEVWAMQVLDGKPDKSKFVISEEARKNAERSH